jgi:cobalt-zinc-cadmium efflux system membrane fusion protein
MKIRSLIAVTIFFSFIACTGNNNKESSSDKKSVKGKEITTISVNLTQAQKKETDIQTSGLEKREFTEKLSCAGKIEVLPNYIVTVIPPVKGYIEELYHQNGDYVNKGDKLVKLTHPKYLSIQQDYLSAKTRTEYYEKEYKRQGELAVEKAASLKKMQIAKADYEDAKAKLQSLSQLLNMMNIEPETVKPGKLYSEMYVYAPISGYITDVYSNYGRLADEDNPVYEIMNMNHLRLKLQVPENKTGKISEGQSVEFSAVNSSGKTFNTAIDYIGKKVHTDHNRISVYSYLQNSDMKFRHGMNVNAKIVIANKTEYAVPNEAIVRIDKKLYIFFSFDNGYKLFEVKPGNEKEEFTAIKNYENLLSKRIVTKGAHFLKKQLIAK